ncbi:cytochrome c oxidase assembly protein [Brevundimonas aveniformis]|uniref:cytochrome c oxidase assembly protein n=1 Tax=Brevundimonas aveniformis TaxID=370977 RepID=UPI00041CCAB0|nr:cytochrome c oxidase assembly protein [Brevundimonas aveniformis]
MKIDRNARIALICGVVAVGMVGAAYAAVPLYRLFCQVTGFDGTTQRAVEAPERVLDRTLTVSFDTNVRDLPVTFQAEQLRQTVHVGEPTLAYFRVTNTSDQPVEATAAYNVSPESAGPYFLKLQCFCFESQRIEPGETLEFPIQYFIDETIETEPEGRGIRNVTLSYTFYPTQGFDPEASASSGAAPAPL